MKYLIAFTFLFFSNSPCHSQQKILFLGNSSSICFEKDSISISKTDKLPDSLSSFQAIFIFSTAESILSSSDILRIKDYLEKGGGLYCGAENWPLQAESRQITLAFYAKESWGNFDQEKGVIQTEDTKNNLFLKSDTFPAGSTTVAFPMDYRLKVEVWVDDQPLIQSGTIGDGKIVIDGGYSRFYCANNDVEIDGIFLAILKWLL